MNANVQQDQRYRWTALVSLGWHLAAFTVALFYKWVPREDSSCDDTGGWCFTAKESAELIFLLIVVFLIASMLVSLMTAVPLSRKVASPVAAGTLAAVTSVVLTIVAIVLIFVLNAAV
ncbi:hypothetical protein AB0F72_22105 [Actinoplanes sp. NPDC023936]|uniref:hypothetical protein n=1 Tax=Actinoplanes sp. NPDC023936 TaxID=3154910 RepID=UPI0033EA9C5E